MGENVEAKRASRWTVIRTREWSSSMFTGMRITVQGPLIDPVWQTDVTGMFVASVDLSWMDSDGTAETDILVVDEGIGLSADAIIFATLTALGEIAS
jgi:hypothetical protein